MTLDANQAESDRITQVIQRAADIAFRARVHKALLDLHAHLGAYSGQKLVERRKQSGLDARRWIALRQSTRNAESPAEFQLLASVLGVSARWLATGQRDAGDSSFTRSRLVPPPGWSIFGTLDQQEGPLEFSADTDDGGMPMWQRPLQEVNA
jgi:hypothetical protein